MDEVLRGDWWKLDPKVIVRLYRTGKIIPLDCEEQESVGGSIRPVETQSDVEVEREKALAEIRGAAETIGVRTFVTSGHGNLVQARKQMGL